MARSKPSVTKRASKPVKAAAAVKVPKDAKTPGKKCERAMVRGPFYSAIRKMAKARHTTHIHLDAMGIFENNARVFFDKFAEGAKETLLASKKQRKTLSDVDATHVIAAMFIDRPEYAKKIVARCNQALSAVAASYE